MARGNPRLNFNIQYPTEQVVSRSSLRQGYGLTCKDLGYRTRVETLALDIGSSLLNIGYCFPLCEAPLSPPTSSNSLQLPLVRRSPTGEGGNPLTRNRLRNGERELGPLPQCAVCLDVSMVQGDYPPAGVEPDTCALAFAQLRGVQAAEASEEL